MKKIYLLIIPFLFIAPSLTHASVTITLPTNTTTSITHTLSHVCAWFPYTEGGTFYNALSSTANPATSMTYNDIGADGVKIRVYELSGTSCADAFDTGATYTYLYTVSGHFTLTDPNAVIAPTGVAGMISLSSTTLQNALGLSYDNGVSFMKVQLLMVLGSALGFLQLILKYIIAVVVITWIIVLVWKAFKFFKH